MEPLYIGGEYVAGTSGHWVDVENPATEEVIAQVPEASPADIARAVAAARRVAQVIGDVVAKGARVLHDGGVPGYLSRGYFFESTLIEVADPVRQGLAEEIFGPLATFTPVRDLDNAIELANGSVFGLGASIYTASLETAMRAAKELQAGTVWINDPLKDNDAAPFGGVKFSGLDRELGAEGIAAFTQPKHVHMDFAQAPSPEWWFPYKRPALETSTA